MHVYFTVGWQRAVRGLAAIVGWQRGFGGLAGRSLPPSFAPSGGASALAAAGLICRSRGSAAFWSFLFTWAARFGPLGKRGYSSSACCYAGWLDLVTLQVAPFCPWSQPPSELCFSLGFSRSYSACFGSG